jgi:transposase
VDNLGSHKVNAVRHAIRAAGARLFYLPKYSPDLNPIEQFFTSSNTGYAKQHSEPPRPSTMLSLRSSTLSHRPNAPIRLNGIALLTTLRLSLYGLRTLIW